MLLRLLRQNTDANSVTTNVTGELWVIDPITGNHKICDTIENRDYLIPELIYPLHVTHSPKFGRLLPIINQVPGRTGIRMHAGNGPEDSEGCVLVGHAYETLQGTRLHSSREVERMVTQLLLSVDSTREDIRIDVTHQAPEYPDYPKTDCSHGYALPYASAVRVTMND